MAHSFIYFVMKAQTCPKVVGGSMPAPQHAAVVSLQLVCLCLCVFAIHNEPSVSVPAAYAASENDGKMNVCFYYVTDGAEPAFVASLVRGDIPRAVRFGSGRFQVQYGNLLQV